MSVVQCLESDHEEADSHMCVHIAHAAQTLHPSRMVVWSLDYDVLALRPRYQIITPINEFYLRTGKENKKRFMPIHEISRKMGEEFILLLPALQALSGCDSTSSFSGYGKSSFFKCIVNNPDLIPRLTSIGDNPSEISEETEKACTELVLKIYDKTGKHSTSGSLNKLQYAMFAKKGLTSERLPPTCDAFIQHLKRVTFQAFIWKNAIIQC